MHRLRVKLAGADWSVMISGMPEGLVNPIRELKRGSYVNVQTVDYQSPYSNAVKTFVTVGWSEHSPGEGNNFNWICIKIGTCLKHLLVIFNYVAVGASPIAGLTTIFQLFDELGYRVAATSGTRIENEAKYIWTLQK